MIIVGVDNGISGALAAISSHHGKMIEMIPMPSLKSRSGNEVDVKAVAKWISDLNSEITVIIEEPTGSQNASAAKSMGGSFHALRTICVLKNYRWHRITPQAWQKALLPNCKAGETKKRALALVRQLWPEESFMRTDRCKKADEGLVDAAAIAEYGRRARL